MYRKAFYTTTTLFLAFLVLGLTSSCKKSCVIETSDISSGTIIEDISLFPSSGGMTGSMAGVYHVTSTHNYAPNFEMSFDDGVTKVPVNYSQYSILCFPMIVNCEVSFDREVSVNATAGTATYRIRAFQCKQAKCDEKRSVENYVVVPAIPASYTIIYDVDIVES
jgi:hypothetical protein